MSRKKSTQLQAAPNGPNYTPWLLGAGALGLLWAMTGKKEKPVEYSANPPEPQKPTDLSSIKTLQIFGDSQMEPLGPLLVRGLAGKGITATYVFNRGWTLADYLTKKSYRSSPSSNKGDQPNDLNLGNIVADAVMIQLGTNDSNLSPPPTAGQLDNQYKRLRVLIKDKPLIWVGPARFGTSAQFPTNKEALDRMNRPEGLAVADSIRGLADSYGFKFIDSREFVTSGWYDGIHFNTSVYTTWASGILARL
jgi:lysophospholipase L1-like esterase